MTVDCLTLASVGSLDDISPRIGILNFFPIVTMGNPSIILVGIESLNSEARPSWRQHLEQRQELPRRLPERERSWQPEQQRGLPPRLSSPARARRLTRLSWRVALVARGNRVSGFE